MSVADELAKLNDLREQGVLTDEEFESQKAKLLSEGHAAEASQPAQVEAPSAAAPAASASAPPSTKGSGVLPKVLIALLLLGAVGVLVYFLLGGGSSEAGNLVQQMPADATVVFAADISDIGESEEISTLVKMGAAMEPKAAALLKVMPLDSLESVAGFATKNGGGAALLRGSFEAKTAAPIIAELAQLRERKVDGTNAWGKGDTYMMVFDDNTLLFGERKALPILKKSLSGEGKTVADDEDKMKALGEVDSGAEIILIAELEDKGTGAASLGTEDGMELQAVIFSDKEVLDLIKSKVDESKKEILDGLAKAKTSASKEGSNAPAVLMAMVGPGVEMLEDFVQDFKVDDIEGGLKMSGAAELKTDGKSSGSVATMGVIAVVAIPAFVKYMRRAKTVEAIDQLDKLYRGAVVYYSTPHVDASGRLLPCQFPANQGVTPVEGTCCSTGGLGGPDNNGDDRCDSSPATWDEMTWSALSFQMSDEHYFVYAFDSEGVNGEANFRITANADLDCDSIQSTFQRIAFGAPDSVPGNCRVQGAPALFVDQETE